MPWPCEKNHVEIVFLDLPVQMNVDERQSRTRSPMPEQPVLEVFRPQWLGEQWIMLQINHAQAQVIARFPVRFNLPQFLGTQRFRADGRACRRIRTECGDIGGDLGFDRAHRYSFSLAYAPTPASDNGSRSISLEYFQTRRATGRSVYSN